MKKSPASIILDVLIVFAMVFGTLLLCWVAKGSLTYWTSVVKDVKDTNAFLFWCGLLIAIVYAIFQFIAGFIQEIARTIKGKRRFN